MELRYVGSSLSWLYFVHIVLLSFTSSTLGGNETDVLSLLAFKASINDDPQGILNSWNESLHFCQWRGVTCDGERQSVTMLDLQSCQLKGQLSPHVGNLSFLTTLNLRSNSFGHAIPHEIARLSRLQALDLGNNSFDGEIPVDISRCSNLEFLALNLNNLTGNLPGGIGSLSKLKVLDLNSNNLVGDIPESFGNISTLLEIDLGQNSLQGGIPRTFGQLKSLTNLRLGENNLKGTIPPSIFNLSSLTEISLALNQLEGTLPHDLGHTLPNLETLMLHANHFTGKIPFSLSNASKLASLELSYNNFTGQVPSFANLPNLQRLGFVWNNLGYGKDDDLNFLSSLVNCTNLQLLGISDNNLGGSLPESISNFSTKLTWMVFGGNPISGIIPSGIGNLISLETLGFNGNELEGPIPESIGELKNLNDLFLNGNKLSGTIPYSIGNLTSLGRLNLAMNRLEGTIPTSIKQCKNLRNLDLGQNNLSGPIPKEVLLELSSSLSQYLVLSKNHLTGSIPVEVGKLVNLYYMDLSENKLSGEIPETLGGCTSLAYLNLEGNLLLGAIPQSLGNLRGIEQIDFSSNNLSGKIPTFFENFPFLESLNLSFNNFEGQVPAEGVFKNSSAFFVKGNPRLCGGITQLGLPKCMISNPNKHKLSTKKKLMISIITSGLVGLVLVTLLLLVLRYRSKKRATTSSISKSHSFGIPFLQVSYGDLSKATDGFSPTNLIGVGSFGSVYKGTLNQDLENIVAVKVLNLQASKASNSFIAECQSLKGIKHRNIVKLLTACSSIDFQGNDFKALVYEYMVNGSLDEWLHGGERQLDLFQRLSIAIDVASALDYMHNHCHMKIAHCDLKPSNVLLDGDMTARLGDFGLARLLPDVSKPFLLDQTNSLGIRGSIGYAAPEYGMGSEASTSGDVYSFGILLLEIFTGKRPTDGIFGDDLNLPNFASIALLDRVEEILDPVLLEEEEEEDCKRHGAPMLRDCLIFIIKIGVACSSRLPRERMKIADVVTKLCHVRDVLLGTRTRTNTEDISETKISILPES
ncbi:Serine/threonine protein kinase [Trema orientale]|uniref:non-specific serine/threonine protein kinase n=1 Tax=Trema orientale TaxID=63057 RepID=A0A2P5FM34_TREOI|nr:Serine/threonine protein kinase [Trema orientale]